MTVYAYVVAGAVLLIGIAGIATSRNLVHAVVSLSVAQSATYILLNLAADVISIATNPRLLHPR